MEDQLNGLRLRLSSEQQRILKLMWDYYLIHGQWIRNRILYHQFGRTGKASVMAALDPLGGSIVFERGYADDAHYELTFLGVLLTDRGEEAEALLVRYLTYLQDRFELDPEIKEVTGSEIQMDLGLTSEQLSLLRGVALDYHFSGGGGGTAEEWNAKLPHNMSDLYSYSVEDLQAYVRKCALEGFDPAVPIDENGRSSYLSSRYKQQVLPPPSQEKLTYMSFIDMGRIKELRSIRSSQFDLTKLIRLCEELNVCYSNACYLAVSMLTRSLLDHVPPIFGFSTFADLANQYAGNGKSFKQCMSHLENSSRKIADSHLHSRIRSREILPNETQVNFASDLDMLLAEIVRLLK